MLAFALQMEVIAWAQPQLIPNRLRQDYAAGFVQRDLRVHNTIV
jgi:hypothetical protein